MKKKRQDRRAQNRKAPSRKKGLSFDEFYREIFPERWPALRESLLAEGVYTELSDGLLQPYYLDEASYYTALALEAEKDDEVLDMCAAPGGKTLVLATSSPATAIQANEKSGKRRERLRRVLREHLGEIRAKEIVVSGHDAALLFRRIPSRFSKILLDVPCSSERHVLASPSHLERWSPARTKHLSIQAFAMLASALEVARPGGTILYSTCALSPHENDDVVGKLYEKREGRFLIEEVRLPFGEKTRYGWQVLPDESGGRGPMYAAKIIRTD